MQNESCPIYVYVPQIREAATVMLSGGINFAFMNGEQVLQCVAVCCSVLQCVVVWCSEVQCGAVWGSVVQRDAVGGHSCRLL